MVIAGSRLKLFGSGARRSCDGHFLASWNVAGIAQEDILTAMDSQVNGDIIALQEFAKGKDGWASTKGKECPRMCGRTSRCTEG